jgi:hypothetical protein
MKCFNSIITKSKAMIKELEEVTRPEPRDDVQNLPIQKKTYKLEALKSQKDTFIDANQSFVINRRNS